MDGDNAAGEIAKAGARKPCGIQHGLELLLLWKHANAFDQIAIGLPITRYDFSDSRNCGERKCVIGDRKSVV